MPDTLKTAASGLMADKIALFAAGLSSEGVATLLGFFHLAAARRADAAPEIALSLDADGRMSLHIEVRTSPIEEPGDIV